MFNFTSKIAFNSASIVLFGIIAGAIPLALCQFNQRAVIYDEFNGEGNYMEVTEQYVADFSLTAFDNKVRSVCLTGIWLFYEDALYNKDGNWRSMQYVFGRDNYCVNLERLPNSISSLRYAGNPRNFSADSFTLYQFEYFQGEEESTYEDLPNLMKLWEEHTSIIITGHTNWEVFDEDNFKGNRICLKVPEPDHVRPTPAFIYSIYNKEIPKGSIRSVKKGCSDDA